MEVCRHAAHVRPAARGRQGNHRQRRPDGRKDQDGDGRSNCHRPGNIEKLGLGTNILDANALGRHKEEGDAGGH